MVPCCEKSAGMVCDLRQEGSDGDRRLAAALLHGAMGCRVLAWLRGPLRRRAGTETATRNGEVKTIGIRTDVKEEDIAVGRD
jgi:hypothetical protein